LVAFLLSISIQEVFKYLKTARTAFQPGGHREIWASRPVGGNEMQT